MGVFGPDVAVIVFVIVIGIANVPVIGRVIVRVVEGVGKTGPVLIIPVAGVPI